MLHHSPKKILSTSGPKQLADDILAKERRIADIPANVNALLTRKP
jgi:hypothetical protein